MMIPWYVPGVTGSAPDPAAPTPASKDNVVSWTAACPACGADCTWTATPKSGTTPEYDIDCPCDAGIVAPGAGSQRRDATPPCVLSPTAAESAPL